MARLEGPIGPNGAIIDVRIAIGSEDARDLAAAGHPVISPFSVPGIVDTGAEVSAIQLSVADWMGISVTRFLEARSSVLGDEFRVVPVYRVQMTFGSIEASDVPKRRQVNVVGVSIVSPGASIRSRS